MEISFDPEKRRITLQVRGLDFLDAPSVFETEIAFRPDVRFPYPEERFITAGRLNERVVVVVWTPTKTGRRIISMRYAHAKDARAWTR